jgi:hypothetical protein
LPTLTESAFATLFALADLLAPASIQRGIDGGEDVLAAGGPEFGLDLPPAGQLRGTAAGCDGIDGVVRDLDNQPVPGVQDPVTYISASRGS